MSAANQAWLPFDNSEEFQAAKEESAAPAAAMIQAKPFHYLPIDRPQDVFEECGWTPSRSTLLNPVKQGELVVTPLELFLCGRAPADVAVGLGVYLKDVLDQLLALTRVGPTQIWASRATPALALGVRRISIT